MRLIDPISWQNFHEICRKFVYDLAKMKVGKVLALVLLVLFSCKKKDKVSPYLVVNSPSASVFSVIAEDSIQISGQVSDLGGLSYLQVVLENEKGEIINSQVELLSGNSSDFDFVFIAGDLFTPSCICELKIRAIDKSDNVTVWFTLVDLVEIPRERQAMLFAGENAGGVWSVFRQEQDGQIGPGLNLGLHLSDFKVDNYNQQLFLAYSTGTLKTVDLLSPITELSSITIPNGGQSDVFSQVFPRRYEVLAGMGVEPFLKMFTPQLSPLVNFNEVVNPSSALFADDYRVFVGQGLQAPQTLGVESYNLATRQKISGHSLSYKPEYIGSAGENHILVAGNLGGIAKISILDRENLLESASFSPSGSFLAGATGSNATWLILSDKVLSYNHNTGLISPFLNTAYFSAAYEWESGEVWLGKTDQIDRFNSAGQLLGNYNGNFNSIRFLGFQYNK